MSWLYSPYSVMLPFESITHSYHIHSHTRTPLLLLSTAFHNGNTTKLNQERADQLAAINFEANEAKPRGRPRIQQIIPDVPWKKRIAQIISYKEDVGHLNIDHQYKHCDNLGGWAVSMSNKYQKWKNGEVVGPAMEAQFDELKSLGFNFDIPSVYETTRSWDDHFEKLKEYKEQHGNARVPLKWKADLRLGKWVQLQRKAKRTKKMTGEHRKYILFSALLCFVEIVLLLSSVCSFCERMSNLVTSYSAGEKLESIGFEWEVPRDEQYQQPPQQQQQQQQGPVATV